jgi:cyclase
VKSKLFFILLLIPFALFAQTQTQTQHHEQTPKDVFKLTEMGGSVYALFGRGGNTGFFVGPDSVFVVDSQFLDLAPGIVEQIKKVTDKPVRYLLNTHHHGDHVGGNEYFLKFAVILAQDNVRKRVLASPQNILELYPAELEKARQAGDADRAKYLETRLEWAKKVKVDEIAAPFLTFDSEFRIYLGDETIQVWHVPPAHTDGDSVVYFEKANVLHTGDVFFNNMIPYIDVRGGGSANGYLTSVDKIIAHVPANIKIIPGHGEISDLNGLKKFRQYFVDLIDAANRAKASGKSKDAFLKEVDLPAYKDWDGYPDEFKDNAAVAFDEAK